MFILKHTAGLKPCFVEIVCGQKKYEQRFMLCSNLFKQWLTLLNLIGCLRTVTGRSESECSSSDFLSPQGKKQPSRTYTPKEYFPLCLIISEYLHFTIDKPIISKIKNKSRDHLPFIGKF